MIFSKGKKSSNQKFIKDLIPFVCQEILTSHGDQIAKILEKTLVSELTRVHRAKGTNEIKYWKELDERLKATEDYSNILSEIVGIYAHELARGYSRNTAKGITWALGILFSEVKIFRKRNSFNVSGPIEKIKKLYAKGNLIFVPTHESSVDSMSVGYAIEKTLNIHPVYHVSQLHIYKTWGVKYILNNIGVYPIDWKKKNLIYMLTLDYLTVYSIIRGRSLLFFPDGSLSKKGQLTTNKLKTGLIRAALKAQYSLHKNEVDQKVIIVPVVINYSFVREAKRKINNYLNGTRIKKKQKRRLQGFLHILRYKMKAYVSFGEPIDVFGNVVDEFGQSHDINDKEVDTNSIFEERHGYKNYANFEKDKTKLLTQSIVDNYYASNIILSCHAISYAVLSLIQKKHSLSSFEEVAKLDTSEHLNKADICKALSILQNQLIELNQQKKISLSPIMLKSDEELFLDGVNCLFYAIKEVDINNESKFSCEDLPILFYYSNRLLGYDIEI